MSSCYHFRGDTTHPGLLCPFTLRLGLGQPQAWPIRAPHSTGTRTDSRRSLSPRQAKEQQSWDVCETLVKQASSSCGEGPGGWAD